MALLIALGSTALSAGPNVSIGRGAGQENIRPAARGAFPATTPEPQDRPSMAADDAPPALSPSIAVLPAGAMPAPSATPSERMPSHLAEAGRTAF